MAYLLEIAYTHVRGVVVLVKGVKGAGAEQLAPMTMTKSWSGLKFPRAQPLMVKERLAHPYQHLIFAHEHTVGDGCEDEGCTEPDKEEHRAEHTGSGI